MAEGWAKELKANQLEAYSAGIEKHGMNPLAVKAMAEVGVDISAQQSTLIADLPVRRFDWVITLCGHADETCPYVPGKKVHHGFDDPPRLAAKTENEEGKLFHYRRVRDEIRHFVAALPECLQERKE